MGLISRLSAALWNRKSDSMSIDEWFTEFGPSNRSAAGIAINQITAMQVAAVMSCVSILAEDVAKLPVHVYRGLPNGGKKIAADHPLEALLRTPNSWQSGFSFWEQMMVSLLLRGNAYAAIVRDGRGKPVSFVPVNPDRVWIFEGPNGEIFYEVSRRGPHDMAMLKSLPLMVPAEDMLHIPWLSIESSLWGVSRIGVAGEAIGLSLAQQEMASRLAGNNTNLGGVLETDSKLAPDVIERLKKNWREKFGGLRNTGETAVLEQGLKWKQLGMTAIDAEFIASRGFQVLEIARIFRIPPHKLGVVEKSIGTSIEALDQGYMNDTVSSYLGRIESKLSQHFDLDAAGLFVDFDVSRLLRASMQTRLNALGTGVTRMIYTPNEARRAENLPDIKGGDTLYQPVNVAPIGFTPAAAGANGPGSDFTGTAAPGGAGDPAALPDDQAPEG